MLVGHKGNGLSAKIQSAPKALWLREMQDACLINKRVKDQHRLIRG
jgi:hypothetical protein